MASSDFAFLSKASNPVEYVCDLARSMHQYGIEHYLSGPHKHYETNEGLQRELLDLLVPGKQEREGRNGASEMETNEQMETL